MPGLRPGSFSPETHPKMTKMDPQDECPFFAMRRVEDCFRHALVWPTGSAVDCKLRGPRIKSHGPSKLRSLADGLVAREDRLIIEQVGGLKITQKKRDSMIARLPLVDVSDMFYFFFCSGRGKGESEAPGRGRDRLLSKIPGGGGVPEGEGPRGREGVCGELGNF